jgi:anti-anti-sigma factor
MKIDTAREGGAVVLRLGGRLDREWAEQLSTTLEDLLREGVRSLNIDLADVTYISSAATKVLAHTQQELALLRGELQLTALSPAVTETLAAAGWNSRLDAAGARGPASLRLSSWHVQSGLETSGQYQLSTGASDGALTCRLTGYPNQLTRAPYGPDDCTVVEFPGGGFGLGLGAIGSTYEECQPRIGELLSVAGCVAYFPSDGARLADFLVGEESVMPRAVLASGILCEGTFSRLVRFNTKPEAVSIPLSELAGVCLDAVGGRAAGLVIAAETAGLAGARLRRSPVGAGTVPLTFEVPDVRDWLSFAPELTYSLTTTLIAGVVARSPEAPLSFHLRPLDVTGRLYGHLHAAVFSYHPLPQRTVELAPLVRGLFSNHELRDVLHLLSDDRGEFGVGESTLVRGVGWASPISQLS